jgi:glycerol uptake facilitator-like aquaporin
MDGRAVRAAIVELVGAFGLVLFSAGVVCVNSMTSAQTPGTAPLTLHQPGLVGIALAQGMILAVLLALTVPVSGGYLNPAITLTQWAFGRLESVPAAVFIAAQTLGSVLAGGVLRLVFSPEILQSARYGAAHLNPLAYPFVAQSSVLAGTSVELILTFFLAFAMFGIIGSAGGLRAGLAPGMVQAAAVLVAFPLTGAALNPIRWFGPVVCDAMSGAGSNPWNDFLVYLAGPVLGALLGGLFCSRIYPSVTEPAAPGGRETTGRDTAGRGKK